MDPPFILTREEYEATEAISLLSMIAHHFEHASSDMEQLVGVAEAAEFLGVAKPSVSQRKITLPDPIAVLAGGPIWLKRELIPVRERLRERRERRSA
jgi:hypothetical protein